MENTDKEREEAAGSRGSPPRAFILLLFGSIILLVFFLVSTAGRQFDTISYDEFLKQVDKRNITKVDVADSMVKGQFKTPPVAPDKIKEDGTLEQQMDANGRPKKLSRYFRVRLPADPVSQGNLTQLLDDHKEIQRWYGGSNSSMAFFYTLLLALPFVLLLMMYLSNRRREQMMGGNFLSGFSKSPAKRYEGAKQGVTFADVAGLHGVKADLQEIVDYLRSPKKFQRLGGRVPKGVLLNGPPGTGKTLLARAVAGEAGVPFYSVNGSEFIQMFVGVGASRVRDLFRSAKEQGAAIIFIDEIDAVGRQRGAGLGGGHDEREQTLNQILSEMDGFSPVDSVIVLAATNRPDVLDPALLRPGRFDRHVTVGRPTHLGRVEIFNVHVRNVPLDDDVDIDSLASGTIGMTGADIRNLVNEAALWAARKNKKRVSMSDFDYARDKVIMGARREEQLMDEEREKTAYHEAGHTLASWFLKGADRVRKVTIIPRGRTLGSTQIVPAEDRLSISKSQLLDQLVVLLGGRAAEQIIYDETTVGAENDLERATATSRRMVTHWGMSERLGPVSYKMSEEDPFLGRELHQQRQFSERTMEEIDSEVTKILRESESRAVELLRKYNNELESLTNALLDKEELDEDEIAALIGPSVHEERRKLLKERREKARLEKQEKEKQEREEANQETSKDSDSSASTSGDTDPSEDEKDGKAKDGSETKDSAVVESNTSPPESTPES